MKVALLNIFTMILNVLCIAMFVYFFYLFIKSNMTGEEMVFFVSDTWFLVISTAMVAVTATTGVIAGFINMSKLSFRGIFIILLQILFIVGLVFIYNRVLA